jgi:REP element-mobilizing transposase RayT
MARPLRIEFPGAVYHITSRGNAKQVIFLDNQDKNKLIEILSTVVERFHWVCHAYCLMDNHYHLIIETPEGNLSRGMRQLNGVYTQVFNQRHQRIGHLFQGRYKAIIVEKDSHLLSLCRYVVLNPVRAGMVRKPEGWAWSNYRATIGVAKRPAFLKVEWILSQFNNKKDESMKKYKRFVMEGITEGSPWETLKGQIFLATESFIQKLSGELSENVDLKEIPKIQRYAGRPSLEELFKEERLEDKKVKDEIISMAYIQYGYRMREIAEYLGVHYATVSRAVMRVEQQKKRN